MVKNYFSKITTRRVSFLGVYLGIMLALKYLLGFIPGIEVITFLFMIAGIFFPLFDGLLLVSSFNFGIVILYGWGTWQIIYWPLWITNLLLSKMLSKVTKNKYLFASLGFCLGFSVAFWYFLSDLLFFGKTYALANIISAIPINCIEGFTTSIMILTIGQAFSKIFKVHSQRLWGYETVFYFKSFKYKKLSLVLTIVLNIIFISAIILLFFYNQFFLDWKETEFVDYKPAKKI